MPEQRLFTIPLVHIWLTRWYAFVNHRPYLMPVAWSYRFLYCLVHKPKASTDRLADPYTHQEEIAARENLITSWGL